MGMKTIYVVAWSNPNDDGGFVVCETEDAAVDLAEEYAEADWRARETEIRVVEIDLDTVKPIRNYKWSDRMHNWFTHLMPGSLLEVWLASDTILRNVRVDAIIDEDRVRLAKTGRSSGTYVISFDRIEAVHIVGNE